MNLTSAQLPGACKCWKDEFSVQTTFRRDFLYDFPAVFLNVPIIGFIKWPYTSALLIIFFVLLFVLFHSPTTPKNNACPLSSDIISNCYTFYSESSVAEAKATIVRFIPMPRDTKLVSLQKVQSYERYRSLQRFWDWSELTDLAKRLRIIGNWESVVWFPKNIWWTRAQRSFTRIYTIVWKARRQSDRSVKVSLHR